MSFFFFQAEDGIRDFHVTGVQTCALPISKEARTMDTFIHYGIAAAHQAVMDAGLPTGEDLDEEMATRIGCIIGSGIGGLPLIERSEERRVGKECRSRR